MPGSTDQGRDDAAPRVGPLRLPELEATAQTLKAEAAFARELANAAEEKAVACRGRASAAKVEAEAASTKARMAGLFRRHATDAGVLDREGLKKVVEESGHLCGPRELDAALEALGGGGGAAAESLGLRAFLARHASLAPAIAGVELGHLEAVKRERERWVPARDAAALPPGAVASAQSLPRQPLDASLTGRLLTGWATSGDAATIRRLTRSSIWLFSSITFRASRMGGGLSPLARAFSFRASRGFHRSIVAVSLSDC